MVSSQNPTAGVQREQSPDSLPALREMLIQDPRIGKATVRPAGYPSSESPDGAAPKEIDHAPSIAPIAPLIEPNPQQARLQSDGISRERPSVERRLLYIAVRGIIVITLIGAAGALLSYPDNTKRDIIRARDFSLSWLSSVLGFKAGPHPEVAAELVSKSLDRAPAQNTALLPAPGIQIAPAPVSTASSPEPQHQLDTMTSDVADMRRLVDQLAARQDQMAQDLATLQAAEQSLSQRISSLFQSSIVRNSRKKAAKTVYERGPGAYGTRVDGLPIQ